MHPNQPHDHREPGNAAETSERAAEAERHQGFELEEISGIPSLPGVYLMRAGRGQVLYIGKARNLHARVGSYFTRAGEPRVNVRFLMGHVRRVETIITSNEKEAFLLEDTLIKRHQPRYNIRLRDDKTYVSVWINLRHPWPRAVVIRLRGGKRRPGDLFLGPYPSASAIRNTLRQLQRIFPIRSCPDHVLRNRSRPCLLHPIGRCCAPCSRPVDQGEYDEMVQGTILFLKGRTSEVLETLRDQMRRAAEALDYERAAVIRDRIQAIEQSTERQGVHRHEGRDRDVVALERDGGYGAFVVFVYRNGVMVSSRPFLVRDPGTPDDQMMEEFLSRYYALETPPSELAVDPSPSGVAGLREVLSDHREGRCQITVPQRGEKRQLIQTARENARRLLEQHLSGQASIHQVQREIMERLRLPHSPDPIECYDISTLQGHATVGSMVTFRGGEPERSRYRRYRIKTVRGADDFASLREVLTRRFRRVAAGEEEPPGLVVMDGGKGQLAVATEVLEEMGLAGTPVVGMAKEKIRRRGDQTERSEDRFFLPGRKNPVRFRANSPALYLLQRLRDEAHRFGVTYHRRLRSRRDLRSVLEDIPGVGPTRARRMLGHFGSLKRLAVATPEQIAEVRGVPRPVAERVHERLRAIPEGSSATPRPEEGEAGAHSDT